MSRTVTTPRVGAKALHPTLQPRDPLTMKLTITKRLLALAVAGLALTGLAACTPEEEGSAPKAEISETAEAPEATVPETPEATTELGRAPNAAETARGP